MTRPLAPCGTEAAYRRHRRRGEHADAACRAANVAATQNRKARQAPAPRQRAERPPPPCGTKAAYERHKRLGESPCQPCRDANATYVRGWRNGARTRAVRKDRGVPRPHTRKEARQPDPTPAPRAGTAETQLRAARLTVEAHALDPQDQALLLDMLGLQQAAQAGAA